MRFTSKLLILILFYLSFLQNSFSDNHNIYEIIDQLQKDIKTLEKAVYSNSTGMNNTNTNNLNNNSEDVLTRHLLKLSEIENQFQQLTNKFEEINFKLDKLSNRMSKVQADNQIRFQDLETGITGNNNEKKLSKKTSNDEDEILPGSSQPQDLGSVSYNDTDTNQTSQQTQSL